MRVIVPLQGVVQGTGGLIWGSVIPCALFYFLQLYFKTRHRNRQSPPSNNLPLPELSVLPRSLSQRVRGSTASACISGRVNSIVAESPYYVGLNKVADNPYHQIHNPDGVIQLGLHQNTVSFFSFYFLFSYFQSYNCVSDSSVLLLVVAICGFDSRMDSSLWKRCYIGDTSKLWMPQYY